MSVLTMNYVVNPLKGFGATIMRGFEISGYHRAATVLTMYGYHKEAANCYKMAAELKAK